jgi:hypothetical protein
VFECPFPNHWVTYGSKIRMKIAHVLLLTLSVVASFVGPLDDWSIRSQIRAFIQSCSQSTRLPTVGKTPENHTDNM